MVRQREKKVLRAVKAARASRHPNKFTKLKCGFLSVVQMMLLRLNACCECHRQNEAKMERMIALTTAWNRDACQRFPANTNI